MRPVPTPSGVRRVTTSNVERRDYVGSGACAACHDEVYQAWLGSPMRRMTRQAGPAAIQAPFDGQTFRFMGDTATLLTVGPHRFMRLVMRRGGTRLYRITKVIGGRTREDYVGRRVADTAPEAPFTGRDELVMPVSWLLFDRRWRYKGYSVLIPERPGFAPGPRWRTTCIFCHNTAPFLDTVLDDLFGPGAQKYQGSVSDRALPPGRLQQYRVTDPAALDRAVRDELRVLGRPGAVGGDAPLARVLDAGIRTIRQRFDQRHLVEVGIGCETCHGGAREHVEHGASMTFRVASPAFERLEPPGRADTRASRINRACGRCHTVLFSRYADTWEGGRLGHEPGGSAINSGEARDFLLGGCSDQMSCATCHDPHRLDQPGRMGPLGGLPGNPICVACHGAYAGDAAVAAHTHHDPRGGGSACLACHMPRKNLSLVIGLTRYHRIGAPNDPRRVERDRPLECAVCHPTATVAHLVEAMERWWGRRYDRGALSALYGPDLTVNAVLATLDRGKPHERAVALALAGEVRLAGALPLAVAALDNPIALVRYYAEAAIERLAPGRVHLDMSLPGHALVAEAWRQLGLPAGPRP